jgi:hypothetical protein
MVQKEQAEDFISFLDFNDFIFRPIVPLDDLEDYKGEPLKTILLYWRRHRLLPYLEGKWLRISFAQLIWLRILDSLRAFGYPLDKMKMVTDYFFKDAYFNKLPKKNFEYNRELLLKKKKVGTIEEKEESILEFIEQSLNDKGLLYSLNFSVNYLTNLILQGITKRVEAGILIFQDGGVGERIGDEGYFTHKPNTLIDPFAPHLYLSITYYLKEFIDDEELSVLFIPQLLNEDETRVLKELRNKNISKLEITLEKGKVKNVVTNKAGVIGGKEAEEIKKILGLNNYESISLSTRDSKTLYFKRTKKK